MSTTIEGFFLPGECLDRGYMNVRDLPNFGDTRHFIESLWHRYAPLADRHFRKDAKNHFLQRFWEMYLVVALMERGLKPLRSGHRGPEVFFEHSQTRIWVEAVVPGPGTGKDRVPKPQDAVVTQVPTEKILLRFTQALVDKREKYLEALQKGVVATNDGYLLAINSRGIPHAPYGNTMPFFVQAFLPIGPITIQFDRKSGNIANSFYQYRDMVKKQAGTNISTKAFLEPEFAFVSAVLHSSVDCVNRPEGLGADFCILHNPGAANPIHPSVFSLSRQFVVRDDELIEVEP